MAGGRFYLGIRAQGSGKCSIDETGTASTIHLASSSRSPLFANYPGVVDSTVNGCQ